MEKDVKILVVDDNKQNLQVIGSVLRSKSYNLAFANNPLEALKIIKEDNFDLLLLDVMMPQMDGFELTTIIRKELKLDLPIIFLSALKEKDEVLKGFDVGGQDYLGKPFDRRELLARVETQVELFEARKRLANINDELEGKVKQRTSELELANENLEKANRKLSSLDEAKVEFLSIISHEIRTPMNSIKGFGQLLKSEKVPENLQMYIDMILESSERLEEFSNMALDITSLKLKKYKLLEEEFSTVSLLSTVIARQEKIIKAKGISVELTNESYDVFISAEYSLMKRAVGIVLNNAISHSPENSIIDIISRAKDNCQEIIIRDSGDGFSDEMLQAGLQLYSTGKTHYNLNMGLQLPLACLIMKAHHGDLQLENLEMGGAQVTLRIPLTSKEKQKAEVIEDYELLSQDNQSC